MQPPAKELNGSSDLVSSPVHSNDLLRRTFIGGTLIGAASALLTGSPALSSPLVPSAPDDESGWGRVAKFYPARVKDGWINLEFGAFGQMPVTVEKAFETYTHQINADGAAFTRSEFGKYYKLLRQRIADMLNADVHEIALTRNATEAMFALIGGYNKLRQGDGVLISDHDYDAMQTACLGLRTLKGVDVIKIDLPYPATRQNLIDAYDQALSKNPHIRMMVLTHISHRDGLRLPVDEILNLARARGIDVLVDCAHAWGQQSIDLRSMGIEFAAFNLHKWLGAPIGVGAVFIAKSRIQDIAPFMGQSEREADPIDARIHTGTVNFAAQMAAIDALDFHTQLGSDRCGARFSYLRDYWVQHVCDVPRIEILTPDDLSLHAGITSFRLAGENSRAANIALAEQLRKQHKIVTVMREGLASGACLRITPGYSTNVEDMNVLIKALRTL